MPRLSRRALAQQLVDLTTEIAPAVAKIDEVKEDLRVLAEDEGQGFIEEVTGGAVEVKAAREKTFRGIVPELKVEAFLSLPEARQQKLIEQGLVAMTQQFSSAARASVTVRL
jgi:hypothetical protein